jgi:hypothetical protein
MIKTEERSDLEKQNSNFNSYRKEVLEVLENLKTLKQKKLKESEVEDYLKFVKNNMRFNIDSYIGYDSRALKKDSFIKAFEGLTLESLDKIKIKLKSMAIELNFQKGYPVLFSKQTPNPKNDYGLRSNAITTFTGRPGYFMKNLRLKEINYKLSPSDYTVNTRFVIEFLSTDKLKEEDEFFKLFYKTLDNYRKRIVEDWISALNRDYTSLIEKPKLASFDYRIERIREIQNFLGLELFEWNFAYEN